VIFREEDVGGRERVTTDEEFDSRSLSKVDFVNIFRRSPLLHNGA